MNQEKLLRFHNLLRRQESGDASALGELHAISPNLEDGYCIYNAYEQWEGAFCFSPGAKASLPAIISLIGKVLSYKKDDTLQMYSEPEWKELLKLRGPFECAIRYTCGDCARQYIGFGQSGFDDRYPYICRSCGDVWMQSGYDDEPLPTCDCGGTYRRFGCPHCGSTRIASTECFSNYEYFMTHNWREKGRPTHATEG